MVNQQRRIDDPRDPWSEAYPTGGGFGAGGVLLGTLLGIGIGLLAAPQPGTKTRKQLLERLAALSDEAGDTLEDVQDLTVKARKKARKRLSQLREDAGEGWEEMGDRLQKAKRRFRDEEEEEDSSPFGTILALAAGVAATYFLTSDRAAPVRSRVQTAAGDVRRRAADEWDRFQRGGFRSRQTGSEGRSETRTSSSASDEAPEAS